MWIISWSTYIAVTFTAIFTGNSIPAWIAAVIGIVLILIGFVSVM